MDNAQGKWGVRGRHAARLLFGLIFVVFGLNGFLQFMPQPPLPAKAIPFVTGLASAGYFFPLLKTAEIVAGLLLLANRAVPLALVVLAPIVLNIAAFHLLLAPGGAAIAMLVLGLELFLAWSHRRAFAPLFAAGAHDGARGTLRAPSVVAQPSRS